MILWRCVHLRTGGNLRSKCFLYSGGTTCFLANDLVSPQTTQRFAITTLLYSKAFLAGSNLSCIVSGESAITSTKDCEMYHLAFLLLTVAKISPSGVSKRQFSYGLLMAADFLARSFFFLRKENSNKNLNWKSSKRRKKIVRRWPWRVSVSLSYR